MSFVRADFKTRSDVQNTINNFNDTNTNIQTRLNSIKSDIYRAVNNNSNVLVLDDDLLQQFYMSDREFNTEDDVLNFIKAYPWIQGKAASVIYDYQFNIWTKIGSGTINDFSNWTLGSPPDDLVQFVTAGAQYANITQDYNESDTLAYLFSTYVWGVEFSVEIPDDATNRWILEFYSSTTASGGTAQPFVGIFWWGASNNNYMGIRRRNSAGATVVNGNGTKIESDYFRETFLFLHDPNSGEYLYHKVDGAWVEYATITSKSTVNYKHLRVACNTNASATGYTVDFTKFRVGYVCEGRNTYNNYIMAISNWDYTKAIYSDDVYYQDADGYNVERKVFTDLDWFQNTILDPNLQS